MRRSSASAPGAAAPSALAGRAAAGIVSVPEWTAMNVRITISTLLSRTLRMFRA